MAGGGGLALPGEDVEHNISAAGAAGERFGAGRLDRLQPVLQHRREDPHELPVTVVATRQPSPYAAQCAGQLPTLERRAIPQRTGLPCQDRHVVPWIAGDLTASKLRGCSATVSPSWRMTIRSA